MKNLPFTSYDKISESLTKLQINEAGYRLFDKTDWVVTEKVHGANLCFVTNGEHIRCAKRKEFIAEGDNFFNYQRLLKKLESQIQQVFFLVQESYPSVSVILIYGELFGGGYPHPDVTPDPQVNLVQTGVYYSPTIAFYGFDIAIAFDPTKIDSSDSPRTTKNLFRWPPPFKGGREGDKGGGGDRISPNQIYLDYDRKKFFRKPGFFMRVPCLWVSTMQRAIVP